MSKAGRLALHLALIALVPLLALPALFLGGAGLVVLLVPLIAAVTIAVILRPK